MILLSESYCFDDSTKLWSSIFYMLKFGILIAALYYGTRFYHQVVKLGNLLICPHYGFWYSYRLILQIYIASPLIMILLCVASLSIRNQSICWSHFLYLLIIELLTFRSSHVFNIGGRFWLSSGASLIVSITTVRAVIAWFFISVDLRVHWIFHRVSYL